jgi:hypothetical protein
MSCRHDKAIGTCSRCYPKTGTIDPGPESDYEPNMEGPGAVTVDEYRASLGQIAKPNHDDSPAAEDVINHPKHYTWIPGIECRDVVRHMSFNVGSAVKYAWRHMHKGNPIQDIDKAINALMDERVLLFSKMRDKS